MLQTFPARIGHSATAKPLAASLFFLWAATGADAQAMPAPPPTANPSFGGNVASGTLMEFITRTAPYEFWLACIIMLFGLGVLFLYLWGIRGIEGRRPEDVSRSLIVIFVVTGALVLITVGYSTEQIAPAFGLFGTIIGYMLGRMSQSSGSGNLAPGQPNPNAGPESPAAEKPAEP